MTEFKRGDRIRYFMLRMWKDGVFLKYNKDPSRVKVKLDGNAFPQLVDKVQVKPSDTPFLYENNAP